MTTKLIDGVSMMEGPGIEGGGGELPDTQIEATVPYFIQKSRPTPLPVHFDHLRAFWTYILVCSVKSNIAFKR